MNDVIKITGLQQKRTLPRAEAHILLTELMHQGFDCYCSELDKDGNLTVVWPASTEVGKQLNNK